MLHHKRKLVATLDLSKVSFLLTKLRRRLNSELERERESSGGGALKKDRNIAEERAQVCSILTPIFSVRRGFSGSS